MQRLSIDAYYEKYSSKLAIAACFFLPIKLAFAYVFLVPLILLWLAKNRNNIGVSLESGKAVLVPYLFFIAIILFSAIFSVDPLRSFNNLSGVVFFAFSILVFRDASLTCGRKQLILSLVCGQCLAALHSVLEGAFGHILPHAYIGAVTESGQLGITILLACGLMLQGKYLGPVSERDQKNLLFDFFLGVANFCIFSILAFSPYATTSHEWFWPILGAFILAVVLTFAHLQRVRDFNTDLSVTEFLRTTALPILVAALLVNLKRGPWLGILAGGLVFLSLERRKLTLPLLAIAATILMTVQPIRERLLQSEEHFFIVGGRSEIWDIGTELARQFPLGVGYRNSGILRSFSESIPAELNHFHNNFLNVLVETGWLGLALFLWWIFSLLKESFRGGLPPDQRILQRAVGCAIISWQVAGLVEYNYGDSEVVLVAFLTVGILSGLRQKASRLEIEDLAIKTQPALKVGAQT